MAAVRPRGGEYGELARDDRAIALDPHLHAEPLRMAAARHIELFLARELDLHRASRGQRQGAADVLQQHLLLAAKTAADARLDDAHAAHRNLENHRYLAAGVIRHLCAG